MAAETKLDAEARELITRLQNLEYNLISDEMIEQTIMESIISLEDIFGKGSLFSLTIEKLKLEYKVDELKDAIRKAINKTRLSMAGVQASALFPHIEIHRNSLFEAYLVHKKRIKPGRIKKIRRFFWRFGLTIEQAFEKGDKQEVKMLLMEYIEILESQKEFLKKNLNGMLRDLTYDMSLIRNISHELIHWVFYQFADRHNIYSEAINEAYSFTLEKLMHTFDENFVFTKVVLIKEIRDLYKFIIPRKEWYVDEDYIFMRVFTILIGTLIICDSIARKSGDYRNHKLFIKSYSTPIIGLYALIHESVSNLDNIELRNLISNTLLKTAIKEISKCREYIIKDLEKYILELPQLERQETRKRDFTIEYSEWPNLQMAIEKLLHNTKQFSSALGLLIILGNNNEAKAYKDRYLDMFQKTVANILCYLKTKEIGLYSDEKKAMELTIETISKERKDLILVFEGLKSWG